MSTSISAKNQDASGDPFVQVRATKDGRMTTEILGVPTVPRQLPVTATSASMALTATCRRVSVEARGCDIRYVVGTGAQTANAATSHFISAGGVKDFAVPAGATIAAIRETAATVNGTLEITELG